MSPADRRSEPTSVGDVAGDALPHVVGRYEVWDEVARGGMATVHVGRLVAERGFARVVAIKRLREDRLGSGLYAEAFEDEARLGARLRHPNVVCALDVVTDRGRPLLVMEYVEGVSLAELRERGEIPEAITVRVVLDALRGLHAAHEARDAAGRSLGVVHRDVSPENVLVGVDGLSRILDFGVAKAVGRAQRTATGVVKGKLLYMAPEQASGLPVSRACDVWAAGAVLVATLAPSRPTTPEDVEARLGGLPEPIARVARIALERDPRRRFTTAAEMADALEEASRPASPAEVARFVEERCGDEIDRRATVVRRVEGAPVRSPSSAPAAPAIAARGPRRPDARLVVGALLVVGAAAAIAVAVRRPPSTPETTSEPSTSGAAPPLASAAPASVAPAEPRESPPIGAAPSAPAETSPSPKPTAPPRARPPTRGRCDPPFDVDAMGRKHYRVECLDPR